VVDVVERPKRLEDALELPELADVGARVQRLLDIGEQAEADLVGLVMQVACGDVVTARAKLRDKP
jgi:hypothetical protein